MPPPAAKALCSLRVAYGLACLSGVLYFLGVPGMNVWVMAFVTYVPLLVALRGRTPRAAAALGLLAGFVGCLGGFYWLYGMMRLFSGLPPPVCVVLMLATCAYQGGRLSLTCWLTARAANNGWSASLAFVAATIAGDLVYPLLFPWYLVFMMHRTPLLMQAAEIGGVYLAGAILLGPNLAFAELLRAVIEKTRPRRALVIAGIAAPLVASAWGAVRVRQVRALAASSPPLKVGIAQGNLPLLTRDRGLTIHGKLTESLKAKGAGLVVWSESSIEGVVEEDRLEDQRLTHGLDVPVIFGANVRHRDGARVRDFNSALLADRDGKVVGRYDKHYLLPFGEFLPFAGSFPSLYDLSPNSGHMVPGDSVAPLVMNGHPITVLICYEDILPWFVNGAVATGKPELLVNITVDTWFGDTIEPWEHLALAQLRAIEHRRYLVRATNSGLSAIVDPTGAVTKHGGLFKQETLLGQVRLMAPSTIYEAVGDVPWYAVALGALGMALAPRKKKES